MRNNENKRISVINAVIFVLSFKSLTYFFMIPPIKE